MREKEREMRGEIERERESEPHRSTAAAKITAIITELQQIVVFMVITKIFADNYMHMQV